MHTVVMDSVSVSAARDLVRITAPSDRKVMVKYVSVKQDVAATPQTCIVAIYRASDVGTGTAFVPNTFEGGVDPFQGSAVVDLSVATTKLPLTPLVSESALMTDGWYWESDDDTNDIEIPPGGHLVVRLDSAPTGATVFSANVRFKQAS